MRPSTRPDMRAHLLDAALRAFAAGGYEGTPVRRIAEEAGVAPGLLYHYFPSKEAVLVALFDRSAELVATSFVRAMGEPDPRRRLGLLLQAGADVVRENLDFYRLSYAVRGERAVIAGLSDRIAALHAGTLAAWTALLTECGVPDPETEARLLFASFDGVAQHFVLDPDRYPLDAVVASLVRRTLEAP